ncbi:hypothetical protein BRARA_C01337 [Brassica rapa]|uniref:Uncharacterized protein n=1 Tax=Brassica campestris TaxID=3711 RepID=A0A398A264_BRACM|nr:hypothetical protein BRARA_C01337 [Brassica rapa]
MNNTTVMIYGIARENSVQLGFMCACDKRIDAHVFRNKLFFIPIFSQSKPVVNVEWIGEEMVVTVVCGQCHRGCIYRGDNGHGRYNIIT